MLAAGWAKFPAFRPFLVLVLVLVAVPVGGQTKSGGSGSFGGVGLQVVPLVSGELVVLRVMDNSPAAASGIRPGDLIIRVDHSPMKGTDFSEVVTKYLWGEPGTTVQLQVLRPGETGEISFTLRRVSMDPNAAAPPGVEMLRPEPGKK